MTYIVVGALIGVVVFFLLRSYQGVNNYRQNGKTAREILDERYARGEINEEEYERMKNNLYKV